jgi:outer membrane protein assembly factor BamB
VTSLQNLLNDGCSVIVPIGPTNSTPNACRTGATPGVDPTTNAKGSGAIFDQASSSPTALPDGSVLFGVFTNYNGQRGHLLKFDSSGVFLAAYDFGWDSTPAVYTHNGTYSILVKDNHYPVALYCSVSSPICASQPDGPYYITQLSANMLVEWQFQNTTNQTGQNGFEWCINMPAVDVNGNVFSPAEDGFVYSIPQGNGVFTTPNAKLFTNQALGAAYTPLSFDAAGIVYAQNDGHLFAVGN